VRGDHSSQLLSPDARFDDPVGAPSGAEALEGPCSGGDRRRQIVHLLGGTRDAVPGENLAERFGVSRQAIVHDIALIRAAGKPIIATVRGYVLAPSSGRMAHRSVVAVRHGAEAAEAELNALVDAGVCVVDVVVEHPVYGEMRKDLWIATRADVVAWVGATRRSRAHLLSELTDGVHSHTLEADEAAQLERARAALREQGFLLDDR
jgi:uncharacterized protein